LLLIHLREHVELKVLQLRHKVMRVKVFQFVAHLLALI
jgi:hypothetical protein